MLKNVTMILGALLLFDSTLLIWQRGRPQKPRHTAHPRGHSPGCLQRARAVRTSRRADECCGGFILAMDANGNPGPTVISRRPNGCPHAFCGCEASLYLFGAIRADLNLASELGPGSFRIRHRRRAWPLVRNPPRDGADEPCRRQQLAGARRQFGWRADPRTRGVDQRLHDCESARRVNAGGVHCWVGRASPGPLHSVSDLLH